MRNFLRLCFNSAASTAQVLVREIRLGGFEGCFSVYLRYCFSYQTGANRISVWKARTGALRAMFWCFLVDAAMICERGLSPEGKNLGLKVVTVGHFLRFALYNKRGYEPFIRADF